MLLEERYMLPTSATVYTWSIIQQHYGHKE